MTAADAGAATRAGQRPTAATVDRSKAEFAASARCLAHLDPELMGAIGAAVGDVVEIATELGRRTVARLGEPLETDRGSGALRLDRFIRQALKARMNDRVEVRPERLPAARRVVVAAPVDVSRAHGIVDHLRQLFADSQTPCAVGARLYAAFPGSSAGAVYEVVEVDEDPAVFVADTELEIEAPGTRHDEGAFDVSFEDIGGLRRQITLLRELVQLPLQMPFVYRQLGINAPRGIVLYGPPGCGKTHLARAVANEVNAKFQFINGPAVVGTMQGETESNLRRIFNEAAHHAPSIIFIDELDAIAPHRGQSGSQSDVRAVTTLLSLMDGLQKVDGVVVIGTTNRIEAVDVAFRRPGRFDREVYIGPPDEAGRREILEIHAREMPLAEAAHEHLAHVAKVSHGFVGADLMELCREAGLNSLRRSASALRDHLGAFRITGDVDLEVDAADFDEALTKIRPSALRESWVAVPQVDWPDVGGLAEVKRQLRDLVEQPLLEGERLRALGLEPPTGVVLYGPPGTGKTLLVHALARSAKVNFLAVDGPEIFSKWLGESEEAVRQLFKVARQLAPVIIFFDQLDAIAPRRGSDAGTKTTERVVNQLLAELDGVREVHGIVALAATDRLDLVDPAVLRPGRLGVRIAVPLPDFEDRVEVLRIHLRDVPLDRGLAVDVVAERLASRAEGLSGADLRAIVERSKLIALGEQRAEDRVVITREHLLQALALTGMDHEPASDGRRTPEKGRELGIV